MKSILRILVVALTFAGSRGAVAASFDGFGGNALLEDCTSAERLVDHQPSSHFEATYCLAFIEGVRNTMIVLDWALAPGMRTCWPGPKGISNGQAMRIVLKYLRQHPEKLQLPKVELAIAALHEAYPCRQP
ncbi:MAG TPA: Rap1a/Tai family immunity protein [Rhodocyclaceae bacterium]|nr:Rap1a/Tai family immunity protein [Rhodocyclaceae bacterium]